MTLAELKKLAGIPGANSPLSGSNISITGTEKKRIEREKHIEPGTDQWFQLWFNRPYLTGERVPGFRSRKK
jgi:hypothetical protein